MDDEWKGTRWSEEEVQAFRDRSMLQTLACPKAACRRAQNCMAGWRPRFKCGRPVTQAEAVAEYRAYAPIERFVFMRIMEEQALDAAAAEAARTAREAREKRRQRIAFRRARARLSRER